MRTSRTRTMLSVSLAAGGLLLASVPAAAAGDPAPTPSEINTITAEIYGPPPDEWAPHGTIIADSGFDPAYDSFPFVNYGATFGDNAVLGYPEGDAVVNLTAVEAQALYGVKQACTVGSGRDCVLTPPMTAWLWYLNSDAFDGGHCFGIAALVAGLFDGVVSREGLTSSWANVGVGLSPAVQRKISELFVTQLSLTDAEDAANALPPDQLVNQLVQFLPSGTLPYVLTLFWTDENGNTEGHGITPIAVYSKGNDLVDIAVYDNNYPLRTRAVHVDLAANTWEYEVFASPGEEPTIAKGDAESLNLALVPLTQIFQPQDCEFCYGAPEGTSMAMVVPLSADPGKLAVDFVDEKGRPMTVTPLPAVPLSNIVQVPSSGRYTIKVQAHGKPATTEYLVQTFGPGESMSAIVVSDSTGLAEVNVDMLRDTMLVTTSPGALAMQSVVNRDRRAIDSGMSVALRKPYPKASVASSFRLSESGQVQRAEFLGERPTHVRVSAQRVSPATGVIAAQADVVLSKGDRVSTDLATWRKGVAPVMTVRRADGTTKVLKTEVIAPAAYSTAVYEEPLG